jgi:AcrR family transcriptional regulator
MPPARGDHDARRRDVSEAVWSVLAEHGFGGLTLRAVAARMGASTGLLTHYFPGKRDLVAHALAILDERTQYRQLREAGEPGLDGLRAVLADILPLTPDGVALNRIWVSSWDVALADSGLGADQAARYERARARIRVQVKAAQARTELSPDVDADRIAATALAFVHGLVVQALFAPEDFTPALQTELLDAFLTSLPRPQA